MLTDNEIKRVAEDALGFKAWARTLEEIVCSSKTPITIGIHGEWGSGKTSLMRMTEDLLREKKEVRTVWFDAWKFDKTYDLRVALIDRILRKIKDDRSIDETLREKVEEFLKKVNWLGLGKTVISSFLPLPSAVTNVMDSLVESQLKNPEEIPGKTLELIGNFEDEFKDIIRRYVGDNGRLVVFIDDLDRCIPEKAIDVLEAIKLFLNVEGSVFVIGADKKVIEDGILQKYGEKSRTWGMNYLDKIIQIPVNLPPLRKDIITEKFILGLEISDEIKKYAGIIAEAGDNPRTIKRLLNRFEIQRILAKKRELKVDSGVMAKFVVIEFRWPGFYKDLMSIYSETRTNLIQILKEISKGSDIEGGKRLEEWEALKKYYSDKRLMKFLLEEEPLLLDIDLDHYVYMGRSTTELKESAEDYFNIAYSFGEEEDYIKAIENYDKAIELNPTYEKAWHGRGFALHKLERHEEALPCFTKALELNPKNEEAWYGKGVALDKLGKHAEALPCFTTALELNLENDKAWQGKGVTLHNLEKHEEAVTCLTKALELNPKNEEAWYYKGVELDKLGEHADAMTCFDRAIELNPELKESWYDRGIGLSKLRKYEEAVTCFTRVIKLNPENEEAWYYKGVALSELGKHEEAVACFTNAVKLNSGNEKAWNDRGFALHELGRHEEALVCFANAVKLNPIYEKAFNGRGFALHELGRHEEALPCFTKALELNPKNEEAWYGKGIILRELGKHEEALPCFTKALELNPKNEEAWYSKGVAFDKLWKNEEALPCFTKALELNPKNEEAWYSKGVALRKMGKYEEALACFDKILELSPNNEEVWRARRYLLEKIDRLEKLVQKQRG